MDLTEYIYQKTKRVGKGLRHFKVRNSWGVRDCYCFIRKNRWYNIGKPVSTKDFYHVVRDVNKLLADNLVNGDVVVFPNRMGRLELRKHEVGVKIVNGKLKVSYPIDWEKTLKLWYSDKEAELKKILLRFKSPYTYYVLYSKYPAAYNNKGFYEFAVNKFIKQRLKTKIQNKEIDTLW